MKIRAAIACGVVLALAGSAHAQPRDPDSGPTADVSLTQKAPDATPLVGTSFQLVYTISNQGPEAASDAAFSQYIPAELKIESATSSDSSDRCAMGAEPRDTTTQPPPEPAPAGASPESGGTADGGTGHASPGYYGDSITCALGTLASGETTIVTLDLTRIGARESYTSAWVGSSLNDPVYENNYAELALPADTSNPADVGIALSSPESPAVGADFTYTLKVTNYGPAVAASTTLFNPIGYGLSFVSFAPSRSADTCELTDYSSPEASAPSYGGYSELYCDLGGLNANETALVDVTVTRVSAYEIWNGASVQTTNYDENYDNDYASWYVTADPSVTSNLAVKTIGPERVPLVGETFDITVDVANRGPATAGDTWLSVFLPPGLDVKAMTPNDVCSNEEYGPMPAADAPTSAPSETKGEAYYPIRSGSIACAVGTIDAGGNFRVVLSVTRTSAKELWTSTWVSSSNHDPNYENNYSDLLIEPDKSNPADLEITMTAPTKPDVGADFSFVLNVQNHGPAPAENVVVTDYLPYGVTGNAISSSDSTDACSLTQDRYDEPPPGSAAPAFYGIREARCDLGTMGPQETATITIDVTRNTEYEIWNTAWVYTSNYDEDYENDYASVLVEGEPYPGVCPAGGEFRGTGETDEIVVGPCLAETAGGADSVDVLPPSSGDSRVLTGAGSDTVNVNLAVGSTKRRHVTVSGGRGSDLIRLTVAPGAGNATVTIYGGRGGDWIEVGAPAGTTGLRIIIFGGNGKDRIVWTGTDSPSDGRVPALRVDAGAGVDLIEGGSGDDILDGDDDGDRIFGNLGDDTLRGGPGYDVCRGGPGTDAITGC